MKVQTKVTLLLAAVVAIFLLGLWSFRLYDKAKFRHVAQVRYDEESARFNRVLDRYGESVKTLAEYDSGWDQMVQAIASRDLKWFEGNVNRDTLIGYNVNAAWIYSTDGALVYKVANVETPELPEVPVPREKISSLFATDHFVHFFAMVSGRTLEIRGAAIHPSKDFQRETPPRGYLFVGRLWTRTTDKSDKPELAADKFEKPGFATLDELEMYTGSEITIVPAGTAVPSTEKDDENGSLIFTRALPGWDHKPAAQLVVRYDTPFVREINRSNERMLLMVFAFALVLLLLISTGIHRWVNTPLRHIEESLSRNDLKPIARMAEEKSEFGELARTIHKFFEQSERLIAEMRERRATEEALRKSEEELRHAQKMEAIGRLAGGVAHDFNNLLTAIIGYAELIAGRPKLNSQVKQNAELILKAGEQAATLTKQLLAFSRKQMMQPKVLDMNELVLDIENLLRRVIGERFDVITQRDATDGRVRADPSQVEQVVLNLGVNARDAMPTGGTLIIRTANVQLDQNRAREIGAQTPAGDYVELSVTDTGCGMDEETKSRIFEPFFTTKGPGKGTGLGLATVYGIVRQSGGAISVESEVDNGSTFRLYLPRENAPVDYIRAADLPAVKFDNSETVMVVEDEEIVRELVCEVLEDYGYTVLCASQGAEAMQMAHNHRGKIDLLVTDVIMPEMNGHELATKLTHERPNMKVLYVSGYSDNDIGDHGTLDPRYDLLQKPFTPQTLARKIREVIQDGQLAEVG
ncbi:MAG: ATP-binding protein [Chthoniobacterales bacterium]